ncbi:unnamed protein product [Bursaphelenchus okinawaensis]|uniref:Succinate dehydrogenase assembly factor 3 n=1 Tax=Bursaphelenchus okinawaensis TaxID=465554 RepID=A0A811LAT2_9BILA|nr:unnamed protein product [Bursaphelenchus okinawaensis]CAG9119780.1 unnamed protein product [Bursaphelenchus okinawaensis]
MSQREVSKFPLILYKRILRLHYGLPKELRLMGDSYVKDEFRRHKTASPEQSLLFLKEWTLYCTSLSKQLTHKGIVKGKFGEDLDPELIDRFSDEQIQQLYELKVESEEWKKAKSV